MSASQIQFNNGATYERYMGVWSRLVGTAFLDWLGPRGGDRWLDVGCGNGAFTRLIAERCQAQSITGIDPSTEQVAYARQQPLLAAAHLLIGDAMALPFGAGQFDTAVMPLVIFFLSQPSVGVAEMARVVRQGGVVSAYGWDLTQGGFPYAPLRSTMIDMGMDVPQPPNPEASQTHILEALWTQAGLQQIATRVITVQRRFDGFEAYWQTVLGAPSVGERLAALSAHDQQLLRGRLRAQLQTGPQGQIVCEARANAIRGVV